MSVKRSNSRTKRNLRGTLSDRRDFELKILGHSFKIIFTDSILELGLMNTRSATIYLDSGQADSQLESTLIHEVIEAINALLELGLTHTQICSLEAALHQVYEANS